MKTTEETIRETWEMSLAANLTQNEVFTKEFYKTERFTGPNTNSFGLYVVRTVKEITDGLYYSEIKVGQVPSSGGNVERSQ